LSRRDRGRVVRALLLAPLVPFVLKTDDNPDGIDETMFETLRTARVYDDVEAPTP
jgi:non-heme chloroperoxidase